ncbi:MAG: hypothetical protein DK305_000153 [Chloroflexi bacterium]|jgi:hypothetical protein|nr:MAG: hypothetical protein DK305_000153 [Chloroflexota bacterium]|tara:strand:- start:5068 stop:5571 length:504 start_codon:yes stop_codon:yes gene_type:complete
MSCTVLLFNNEQNTKNLSINQSEILSSNSKFKPISIFGHDKNNDVLGVWFIKNNSNIRAFYSKDPNSSCHLYFRKDIKYKNYTPVFYSECNNSYFNINGEALTTGQLKNLDEFIIQKNELKIIINLNKVKYGDCLTQAMNSNIKCSLKNDVKYGSPEIGRKIGTKSY